MEEIGQLHMLPGTCAACKYLRKRCDESCVLAQFFPSERAEDFHNVNKVFGIQNAMKILASVDEHEREKTAESLVVEAKIRLENPVHGSFAVERKLRAEIDEVKKELDMVNQQLQSFRDEKQDEAAPPPANYPSKPENIDKKCGLWQIDGASDI